MLRLYDYLPSQNGYKVRLLLNLLEIPYDLAEVNIFRGECDSPDFLKMNLAGRTPVLEIGRGSYLPESNAILFYLALGTDFLPSDRYSQAQVLQWLFFEQYTHEPSIAVARYWVLSKQADRKTVELNAKISQGYDALKIMEQHLIGKNYFVGERYSIADISLFAYTHVAHEAGFDLSRFDAINRWMERIRQHPRHYSKIYYYNPADLAGAW